MRIGFASDQCDLSQHVRIQALSINRFDFKLPDIGEGIAEGEVIKWLVKEGVEVKENQLLVEIMTDKVNVEIPSPRKGTILRLMAMEGEAVKVGQVLLIIGEKGEQIAPPAPTSAAVPSPAPTQAKPTAAHQSTVPAASVQFVVGFEPTIRGTNVNSNLHYR